jgi:hypothetical protein
VSPRAGGEAAKFGERYEGRWTVTQLLRVLAGQATSLLVEDEAALAQGAEFTLRRADGGVELHQVKRQPGMAASWSPTALRDAGVLAAASLHAEAGREFHFISTIPATWLERLSDAARRGATPEAFLRVHVAGAEAGREFATLESVFGGLEETWRVLRAVHVVWPQEQHLRSVNAALAAVYLQGAEPTLMAVGLGDLIRENLGLELDLRAIHERLAGYGMRPGALVDEPTLGAAVAATRERWLQSVRRDLLRPVIVRSEADVIARRLRDDPSAVVLISGAAGTGKSVVLEQLVSALETWPVLAMRVDRLGTFSTPRQLAGQLDLPASPVPALGALAGERSSLLLVDQLDAVSLASGRLPDQLDPIVEMIAEAQAFPGMRVILACRQFDLDRDPRLRALVADTGPAELQTVGLLDAAQVDAAVVVLGLQPSRLTAAQRELLALPLNLVLLGVVADEPRALDFSTSNDLLAAFYERKRRDCVRRRETVRFGAVVTALAETMSERQQLSVPRSVLDTDDLDVDADVLASEGVIVRDGSRVAFFHEALFDYAFARAWVARQEDVRDWLLAGDQELFRRAQVRQILVHLHDEQPDRFVRDVRTRLVDAAIRFHIKAAMIDVLSALGTPSAADWRLAMELSDGALAYRIQGALRTEPWFRRSDAEGALERWLDDEERAPIAIQIMQAGAAAHGERVAELVGRLAGRPDYARAVLWLARFAGDRPPRALFERVLEVVRTGGPGVTEDEVFLPFHRLAELEPAWAAELVAAWLAERPDAMTMNGPYVAALRSRDYGLLEMIGGAAAGAPAEFARLLVPYMVDVMRTTAINTDYRPQADNHFSWRDYAADDHQIDERLISAMGQALRRLGDPDPALLAQPFDAAQWLAYQGFIGAGARHADWAADVLTEAPARLESGYHTDSYWTTREVLQTIGEHLNNERLARVEEAVLGLGDEYAAFTLLSALPEERLSANGTDRLAALRERFGRQQPDEPPPSVSDGRVGSPVPQDEAAGFSDNDWLQAMTRYATDDRPHGEGGAQELAQMLEHVAKQEPERFAALGLRLDATYNPVYVVALLKALSEPQAPVHAIAVFELVRHAATLGNAEIERWLGWPLGRLAGEEVPGDIVRLLLGVAMHGDDFAGINSEDLYSVGINTARGQAATALARLLAMDADGRRTALVAGSLRSLAENPSLAVRACVAQLLSTAMRHARDEVLDAVPLLLDADDALLASQPVQQLCLLLDDDATTERMLRSPRDDVREVGGRQAAYTALERGRPALRASALGDVAGRRGAVTVCAARLPFAGDAALAENTVRDAFDDPDASVREAAAGVATALRDAALRPHADLLLRLIASPAFEPALPQLALTLERATDRVDDLIAATFERFLERFGGEARSLATAAAARARQLGELLLRWYAQAEYREGRLRAMDLVDDMLAADAFGVADMVAQAER